MTFLCKGLNLSLKSHKIMFTNRPQNMQSDLIRFKVSSSKKMIIFWWLLPFHCVQKYLYLIWFLYGQYQVTYHDVNHLKYTKQSGHVRRNMIFKMVPFRLEDNVKKLLLFTASPATPANMLCHSKAWSFLPESHSKEKKITAIIHVRRNYYMGMQ